MRRRLVLGLFGSSMLLGLAGCASTEITDTTPVGDERIARPDRVIVYDFSADPADVPANSAVASQASAPSTPRTEKEIEAGRKLGAAVATRLVDDIQAMGLNAVRAEGEPPPSIGDGVLRGYFLSIDEGSVAKRMVIGFGSGSAELHTLVEGFEMTEHGLVQVGSGEVGSGGGKMPGVALPLAVTLVTANPIGLAVGGVVKVADEVSGHDTIEGVGKRTADALAKELRVRFEQRGWVAAKE